MIQVNLLPPEYRTKDRAPISRLLSLVGGVLIVCGAMGFYLYTRMVLVHHERAKHVDKTDERERQRKRAKQYTDLKKEVENYEAREQEIDKIREEDPKYARMLYAMSKMLWDGEQAARPFVAWFTTMAVNQVRQTGRGRAKGDIPELKFSASVADDDGTRVSNFYKALKKEPWMKFEFDMKTINPIKYIKQVHGQFDPPAALNYAVTLRAFPPDVKKKKRDDAKKKTDADKSKPGKGKAAKGKRG